MQAVTCKNLLCFLDVNARHGEDPRVERMAKLLKLNDIHSTGQASLYEFLRLCAAHIPDCSMYALALEHCMQTSVELSEHCIQIGVVLHNTTYICRRVLLRLKRALCTLRAGHSTGASVFLAGLRWSNVAHTSAWGLRPSSPPEFTILMRRDAAAAWFADTSGHQAMASLDSLQLVMALLVSVPLAHAASPEKPCVSLWPDL